MLKQWLCDDCKVEPRNGGQFYLVWNDGTFVVGAYSALDRSTHVAWNWYRAGDSSTQIDVQLIAVGDQTQIDLTLTDGDADFWRASLDALAYTLQTGPGYRVMSRPVVGVMPVLLSEADAMRLGMTSASGVLITGIHPGSGAEAAGLKKDDVLVKVGDTPIDHISAFPKAARKYRGGDVMPIEIFRAGATMRGEIKLGKRSASELPNQAAVADQLRAENIEACDMLAREIAGVPEAVLSRRPEPNEWSVREILAHLLFAERFHQMLAWRIMAGDDLLNWSDNSDIQLIPLLAAYPTTVEMLEALRQTKAGSLALIESLPASVLANKAIYGAVIDGVGGGYFHVNVHMDQIHRTIESLQAAAQPAG